MSTLRVDNVTDLGDDPVVTAGVVAGGALPAGSILQVVSTTKTDTFTTTSTTYTDVTGLSVSITPSSASSKIFVVAAVSYGNNDVGAATHLQLVRDATAIAVGDAGSSQVQATLSNRFNAVGDNSNQSFGSSSFLDSPATASAVTYKVQIRTGTAGTAAINRSGQDANSAVSGRTISSITVIEVAG